MSYFLPLFPLNLVAFPQEKLNLHIFEPRYKQLVNDCWQNDKHFGIPSYVTNRIEYGTEMEVIEIFKIYDDGRLDIKTVGQGIFKVEQYSNPWAEKQYAGGQVETIELIWDKTSAKFELLDLLDQLYGKLDIGREVKYDMETPVYYLAHKVGLSKAQEYQLLQIARESQRVKFLIKHLKKLLPKLNQAAQIRDRIRMNGHFRHMDSLDF
ncbi:MAG: ATP-dependent protease [Cyclobacteriaceae bacterium]|nr:MAG: ATP-dependent protease [Cyclobacteriaceae bacterium]